tara:strand:+ start:1027 stop:1146 length:120 start_codon:yes stop_codon:yes gene_type:complete
MVINILDTRKKSRVFLNSDWIKILEKVVDCLVFRVKMYG